MIDLPSPREWLEEQLERLKISQNELARRAGLSPSQVHEFAEKQSGCDAAIRIANELGVPATVTLALLGRVPPPAKWSDVDSEAIGHIYRLLSDEDRKLLMTFAEFLRERRMNKR